MKPFWSLVAIAGPNDCWPWAGTVDRDGYGVWRHSRAHREAFRRGHPGVPLSSAVVVRHHCDVPACCNPRHLAPGTPAKNVADRVERGRSATGQANGRAVLTEAQVLAIYHSARPASTLSAECGVSRFTVYDIRSGRIWVHLTGHSSHGNVPLREFVGI